MRIAAPLLVLVLFYSINVNSQTTLTTSTTTKILPFNFRNHVTTATNKGPEVKAEKCGFAYLMNKAKAKGFSDAAFESQLSKLIQKKLADGNNHRAQAIVTVPVIFHVVFRTGNSTTINLTQARINAQIQQLNDDYANLSGSAYGVAADMQIRFCAAIVDPFGRTLAEPGIDRINGTTLGWSNTANMGVETFVDYCNNTIKPSTIWDAYSYVNVWTVNNNSGLLGFATFPSLSTLPGLDDTESDLTAGVVIIPGTVGSVTVNGTFAPYNFGRTLTHEAGHFFGLRHIWGDTNCGNDYCNDTPIQDAETAGCPASPQPGNCLPFVNKMFENYMDYSNDACLNTFTADQTNRAISVMANSPRRISLPSSAACQTRAANSIQFPVLASTVVETGTTGTCPKTRTLTLNLGIAGAATGAATVTFNVAGTASNNADYTISPASVTYTNGDNALKPITITLIDDNSIETNETIQISYTITGAGVVAGPDRQVCTITVTDNDFDLMVDNGGPVNLMSEDFDAATSLPNDWVQFANGVNEWVVSANGGSGTTINAAHITEDITGKPNTYDENTPGEAFLISPLIDATGLINVNVAFKWRCIGETFAGDAFDYGQFGYITESDPNTVQLFTPIFNDMVPPDTTAIVTSGNLPANLNNSKFYLVFYWVNDDNSGDDPGFTIDSVVVKGQPLSIETTLNDAGSASQYTSQSAQYISTDNQIIARVSNPNQNVGCITATVQNSGTGSTALNTPAGGFFRSDKVIRLQPAVANTTASYQVTLYFTTAELAVWGGNVPNLKMMKVRDGVNLASIITAADAQIATTTVNDLRGTKGYASFTASFTNGFSQFMLVSPSATLPVNLITFEAKPSGRSIILNWSTALEINNKGFGIERSSDGGNTYKNIGWQNGKINATDRTDYSYVDNFVQPGLTYHYRLRQTDMDAREKLSEIRQAKLENSGLAITLSPNPARDKLVLFISGTRNAADVTLINSQGQVVRSWKKLNASDNQATLNVSGLAAGVYLISIRLPEEIRVEKLVIE